MATDTAEWPSTPVPQPTKDLFNVFYKLADTKSDDVGRQMSENVFTPDAAMLVNKRKFQGKEEISHSRDGSWKGMDYRVHEISKIYTCNEAADDLLLVGKITWGFDNGESKFSEFCARALIDTSKPSQHKFKLYQGWADLSPMLEGLKAVGP